MINLELGPTTPDPNSQVIPPDLQEQDNRKFQVAEQVVKGPLRPICRWISPGHPQDPLSRTFCCSPCLLPVPIGATVHYQVQLGGAGVGAHSPSLVVQPSALDMAAPFSRKVPKSHTAASGKEGQQLGAWDRIASFGLLRELVFLHLLLSRL